MSVEVDYASKHSQRMEQTVRLIRRYASPQSRIACIGLSPFDRELSTAFGEDRVTFLVPSLTFLERISPELRAGLRIEEFDLSVRQPAKLPSFDLVIMTEVLEHILAPDEEVLASVASIISPGGVLIISVPNFVRHVNRVKVILGLNPLQTKRAICVGEFGGHGHLREYTVSELRSLLSRDFRVIELRGLNPYGTAVQRTLLRLLPTSWRSTILAVGQRPQAGGP